MPRPKTEAGLSRFVRDLRAFVESARDEDSNADPETVRRVEKRLASLERELRRLRGRLRSRSYLQRPASYRPSTLGSTAATASISLWSACR